MRIYRIHGHKLIESTARGLLGLANAGALVAYTTQVRKAYGRIAATWLICFMAGQFHILYYSSRTLPNSFAFILSTLALKNFLPDRGVTFDPNRRGKRYRLALYLLTLAGIIFRAELALLLAFYTIFFWARGQLTIRNEILPAAVSGVLIGLSLTVGIDSFFWHEVPMWPELSGFIFNIVGSGADAWGTSPWHFYFTSSLSRLLMNPMLWAVCIPVALYQPSTRSNAITLLTPPLLYIATYSLVPHKEYRFIQYTIPPIAATAATGASYIWTHRAKSMIYTILSTLLVISTLLTFLMSTLALLPLSSLNYPGSLALSRLHDLAKPDTLNSPITVHLDVLSCQTGITRFQQLPSSKPLGPATPELVFQGDEERGIPTLRAGGKVRYGPGWRYDKTDTEPELLDPKFWSQFQYVLTEAPERVIGKWTVLDYVEGFGGVKILRPGQDSDLDVGEAEDLANAAPMHGPSRDVEERFLAFFLGDQGASWVWGDMIKGFVREKVLRGWFVKVRMVPKIWILGREGKK